jgi:hypothetical protein
MGKFEDQFIYENPNASSPIRFVTHRLEFPDKISVLNFDASQNGAWKKNVYLEKDPTGYNGLLLGPKRALEPQDEDKNFTFKRTPDHVSWEGTIPRSGFLVFNDSFAPGWHAWVDGNPVPILRAYGLFMAVSLTDAGFHKVNFDYEPATFRLGIFLSLTAWALLLSGLIGGRIVLPKRRH